jgi:hypothetical protein
VSRGELAPDDLDVRQGIPGDTSRHSRISIAEDLEGKRLLREARSCLDEVIADIRDLEAVLASYRAWVSVPAPFLRAEKHRVA